MRNLPNEQSFGFNEEEDIVGLSIFRRDISRQIILRGSNSKTKKTYFQTEDCSEKQTLRRFKPEEQSERTHSLGVEA